MDKHRISDIEETLLPFSNFEGKKLKKPLTLFTKIDYTKRVVIFVVLNLLGFILQFGSFARFFFSVVTLNPSSFALAYSMGNLLSLIGMVVLTGFRKQYDAITDANRLKISTIFLGSMTLCVLLPLISTGIISKVLILALVAVQMVSYWMYTLSYFPKIQTLIGSSFGLFSKVLTRNN